jgi:hypothetical protein
VPAIHPERDRSIAGENGFHLSDLFHLSLHDAGVIRKFEI